MVIRNRSVPPLFFRVETIAGVWGEVLPPVEPWGQNLQGYSL